MGKITVLDAEKRSIFNLKDILLIFGIIFLAGMFFLWFHLRGSEPASYAEVIIAGETVARLDLEIELIFSPLPNVSIIIQNGRVAVSASDCPDQICVHMGFISIVGQMSICMPNRLVVIIRGQAEDSPDVLVKNP